MFNTMTLTKAGAALCGSLLILLLLSWAGTGLFHIGGSGHGGHGEEMAQAYSIDTGAGGATEAAAEETGPAFAEVYASADPAAGEKVFGKCKSCHKLDGANATGPHLDGVVGRAVGSVDGFGYSDPMKAHGGEWTPEALDEWLANPKTYMPGNKMSFAGLPKIGDRANVIAYLASLGG